MGEIKLFGMNDNDSPIVRLRLIPLGAYLRMQGERKSQKRKNGAKWARQENHVLKLRYENTIASFSDEVKSVSSSLPGGY